MSRNTEQSINRRKMRGSFKKLVNKFKLDLDELIDQWTPVTFPKTRGKHVEYPLTDLIDEGDHYIIEASLPGVKKQNISVEIAADAVRIKGRINLESRRNEDAKYLLREHRRQDFNKEILLPEPVNQKETEAELWDGVLTIRIPKKPPESLEWTKIAVTG